eukprot:TRINITY_DN1989_c0_g1_i1.p1 TRINITY_DN1989_c0_g1~~TRINITY_DN1989_c0_g1_i1.p1  ORF type:complete len:338 (+),score=65.21 TRINITY_DN1989_c0_g1_i1:45-1058(+)
MQRRLRTLLRHLETTTTATVNDPVPISAPVTDQYQTIRILNHVLQPGYTPTDSDLITLNKLGFLASDTDTLHSFLARVDKQRQLLLHPESLCVNSPSAVVTFTPDQQIPYEHIAATHGTLSVYDVAMDWLVGFYSSLYLPVFTGACSYETELGAFVQLSPLLRHRQKYFGLIRDELIVHEIIHIVRGPLQSVQFEELFAYSLSPSWTRRIISPISQQPTDSLVFGAAAMVSVIGDLAVTKLPRWLSLVTKLPWVGTLIIGIIRLWFTRRLLQAAHKRLQQTLPASIVQPLLIRLTDVEIRQLANGTLQIRDYAEERVRRGSFRWRVLWLAYFAQLVR